MNRDKTSPAIREATTCNVAASRYDNRHPTNSFSDLIHRARFSKEQRRLTEDRLAARETLMEADVHVG